MPGARGSLLLQTIPELCRARPRSADHELFRDNFLSPASLVDSRRWVNCAAAR
jgi:hypothetical protein